MTAAADGAISPGRLHRHFCSARIDNTKVHWTHDPLVRLALVGTLVSGGPVGHGIVVKLVLVIRLALVVHWVLVGPVSQGGPVVSD